MITVLFLFFMIINFCPDDYMYVDSSRIICTM